MSTRHPRIAWAAAAAAGVALGFAGAASETPQAALATGGTRSTATGFGWPVKPFDRAHPVRGYFGDPRTIFHAPPTVEGLMHGAVGASFHQGIDVSAPDGAAVYPVVSGVVAGVRPGRVCVDAGDSRSFQYWHITPQVRPGQRVDVGRTVLGRIMRSKQHVHLTVLENRQVVNPLATGRLRPYSDTTKPRVTSITFRQSDTGPRLLPNFLRGRVEMLVTAYDRPAPAAPGLWKGMPTTPALLTWRIARWQRGVAVEETVAYDHRNTEPGNGLFWSTYARGTFQNMGVFGQHSSFLQGGEYVFRLTPRPFDTRSLPDGVYDLVVTATDTRGNHGSLAQRFTVHNAPGWVSTGA
jgi:peptidase M23-like protein